LGSIGPPELIIVFMMALMLGLHFLPTIIAVRRKKANVVAIVLVNVFLGWTIIG